MLELLFYIFIAVVFIQLMYHLVLFSRLAFYKPQKTIVRSEPVSVILYTKNQAEVLVNKIDILLNQQYPTFEIVVINNASTDDTAEILKQYADDFPNIHVVDVKNNEAFWGSTKYALTLGIKASKHDEIIFTDTEQTIDSEHWLANMSAGFSSKKGLVMGIELLEQRKGFLNKIMRFRYISNQQWHINLTKLSQPIGLPLNNVGYKKSVFFDNQGYIRFMNYFHYTHELFFSEAAKRKNTTICLAKDSFSYVEAPKNNREFTQQSVEESAILRQFGNGHRLLKNLYSISVVFFIILAIILLVSAHYQPYIIAAIIIFRYGFCWLINGKTYQYFGYKDLIVWFPLLEWIDLLTQFRITLKSIFHKPLIKK